MVILICNYIGMDNWLYCLPNSLHRSLHVESFIFAQLYSEWMDLFVDLFPQNQT